MSQIYNGSFVLGNTSATTLSAGEGIKLDTSVPGTIGISEDTTVLYENSTGASAMSFSEPLSSFERILVYGSQASVGEWGWTTLLPLGTSYGVCFTRFIGGNNPCQIGGGVLAVNSNHTSGRLTGCGRRWLPLSTGAGGSDTNQFMFKKVIGINHISGGN